jgi:ActR/RegA family two-component response regulator
MMPPFVMLVDDEAPFVKTMTKRLTKRNLEIHWTNTATSMWLFWMLKCRAWTGLKPFRESRPVIL